jgi:hypothetical protein
MSALDLFKSRKALAAGVGLTTRRNKVLPAAAGDTPIPDRIGQGRPKLNSSTSEVEGRTFLFSVYNGTSATLAHRVPGSTSLRIVALNIAVSAATYCIGRLNTYLSRWRDCWRIDGLTFGINGHVPHPTVDMGVVPVHERSALPYVANDGDYYATCIADATRSTVFIGQAQESVAPVVRSISTTGTVKSSINGTNISNSTYSTAGIRLDASENFRMYGMNLSQTANAVFTASPTWSTIKAGRAAPYLQELAYGAYAPIRVRGNPYLTSDNAVNHNPALNNHTSAAYSISPTLCTFYISPSIINRVPGSAPNWEMTWGERYDILYDLTAGDYVASIGEEAIQRTASYVYAIDNSISAYGYDGSDIALSLTATLNVNYSSRRKNARKYYPYTSGGSPAEFSGGSVTDAAADAINTTRVKLSSALAALGDLTDIVCVCSGTYVNNFVYVPTVTSIPLLGTVINNDVVYGLEAAMNAAIAAQDTPGYNQVRANAVLSTPTGTLTASRNKTLSAKTKDHVYADIDEAIYLTLEAELSFARSETYNFSTGIWAATDTYTLNLKYVLSVRGTKYNFPVYYSNSFAVPIVETWSVVDGDAGADPVENWHTDYHQGYKPPPVFAPAFMAQGNCPYMAYTTAAEETAGAAAELYLDISIKVLKYTTFTGTRYSTGVVPFVPHQFLAMFRRYIGFEDKANYPTYPLAQNAAFWDTLFPATPFRIQFANGVPGAWNTVLGAPFTSNPTTEITRL